MKEKGLSDEAILDCYRQTVNTNMELLHADNMMLYTEKESPKNY